MKDVGPSKKPAKAPVKAGLGALAKKAKEPVKAKPVVKAKKPSVISSIFDSIESGTFDSKKIEEKPLTSVKPESSSTLSNNLISSIFESVKSSSKTIENVKSDAAAEDDGSKMKITKVFDFAGEAVE